MLPAALAGWYCADLLSGIVHMHMDYKPTRAGLGLKDLFFYEGSRESAEYQAMFRAAMALINPVERLVFDFKNHHPRPHALGRRDLVTQIGSTVVLGSLPFSILLSIAAVLLDLPGWAIAGATAFLIGGTFSQYFHGTLHRADNPWFIHALRRARLLMTPAMHDIHHASLREDFATINGWSNPMLNRVFTALRRRGHMPDHGLIPE
jgi:hypothetical protein